MAHTKMHASRRGGGCTVSRKGRRTTRKTRPQRREQQRGEELRAVICPLFLREEGGGVLVSSSSISWRYRVDLDPEGGSRRCEEEGGTGEGQQRGGGEHRAILCLLFLGRDGGAAAFSHFPYLLDLTESMWRSSKIK